MADGQQYRRYERPRLRHRIRRRALVARAPPQRWAEEMILFSTPAYGFVELPEPYSTGSSAMPQKKIRLTGAVRGKRLESWAAHHAANLVKGLPSPTTKTCRKRRSVVRRLRHGYRHVAARDRIYEHGRIQRREDESGREFRFYERVGAAAYLVERGVPLASLMKRRQGRSTGRGTRMRSAKASARRLQAIHSSFDAAFHSHLGLPEVLACTTFRRHAPRHVKRALENARERVAVCDLWSWVLQQIASASESFSGR